MTNTHTVAGFSFASVHLPDPSLVTPTELRSAVLLALDERVQLGDKLAEGAAKVIRHLEGQAERLARRSLRQDVDLAKDDARIARQIDADCDKPVQEPVPFDAGKEERR